MYMIKFIKLSYVIINPNAITRIVKHPKSFDIYLKENDFFGMSLLHIGWLSSNYVKLNVSESQNSSDYKIIEDWIDNN